MLCFDTHSILCLPVNKALLVVDEAVDDGGILADAIHTQLADVRFTTVLCIAKRKKSGG